jgi:hypothetical protein
MEDALRGLLVSALDQAAELVELDVLAHSGAAGLVLLVEGHVDGVAVDLPAAHLGDEVVELVALDVQPALEHVALHLLHALADNNRDADLHDFLETLHVGDQVGVEVVALEGVPEVGVAGACELLVEDAQVVHGFGEGAGGRRDTILCGHDGVCGQEGQAKAEVRGGEDCEGFDEDVGDGLVAGEVRVELVPAGQTIVVSDSFSCRPIA